MNNNLNQKSSFNASLRLGYKTLNSEIVFNSLKLPFTNIKQNNITYSGAIGYVNNPSKNIKIALNIASAFRVPNIDDLSKIFESAPGFLIVPNNDIKPEKIISADLGITFWDGNKVQLENNFYFTKIIDQIAVGNFIFNGNSTILYNGQNSIVQANQNLGQGTIAGLSTTFKAKIFNNLLFYSSFNFTHGRIENNLGNFPLDHIPPVFGKVGFKFENKLINLDLNMNYNGNKNLQDYSPSSEDNLVYAPENGMPSWEIYNFKTTFSIIKNTILFLGIENIFDIQYRTFASGINAAGRNFYFGAKYKF